MQDAAPVASSRALLSRVLHLCAIAQHSFGIDADYDAMAQGLEGEPPPRVLARLARSIGFRAKYGRYSLKSLKRTGAFPSLLLRRDGTAAILLGLDDRGWPIVRDLLVDPVDRVLSPKDLALRWRGDAVLLRPRYKRTDESRPFGFRWFLQEVTKQTTAMRDVIAAAMTLNILALLMPVYFQIVVDKVLVHQTWSTLYVLTFGIGIGILFEALLSFARQNVLMHAVQKVDIRVSIQTFKRLLSLPIDFFTRNAAGILTQNMQQSEKVREFLTGQTLGVGIDLCFLIVFIPLLFLYSPPLTSVVIGFAILMALVILTVSTPFWNALQRLYEVEGQRQAHLVESIHGINTVKALGLEPRQRRSWGDISAETVKRGFKVRKISLWARTLIHVLEQMLNVAVICAGVFLVLRHSMSVGELIAFQMLSHRVSSPLIHWAGLYHQYQETKVAVENLGKIMNEPPERPMISRGVRADLRGHIEFRNVTFHYPKADALTMGPGEPALRDVSVSIPAGSMVGIVGHSGSGKSTLARLLLGLYPVRQGSVLIGGTDVREIDLAYLRSHIGVVLQEPFLFRGTIRDNIAIATPDASDDQINCALQLAGADAFVGKMGGLNASLNESASNLSGGQRQRLAIARALLRDPAILLFDEATSALDPESEDAILKQLPEIRRGRTLILITHRLSMTKHADSIVVMKSGSREAQGPHRELLRTRMIGGESRPNSRTYCTLWTTQKKAMEDDDVPPV